MTINDVRHLALFSYLIITIIGPLNDFLDPATCKHEREKSEDKARRNKHCTNKDNRSETKTRSEMTGSIPSGVPHFMFLIIEQSHVDVRSLVLGKVGK